ncbi:MAG TPA: metalloregulator ArsR/SmtB family transcription factor [Vicinamibacterales bacterium]|nr:metalloregulator ArsR/SmtB family transcription factor [Vicinamibacterales bacterium]
MKTAPVQSLEQLLRALADDTRLRILALLASGEICVCHIHGALGIPQPTASRHLASLRRAGLAATRRDGLWVHYRLEMPKDPALAAVLRSTLGALGQARSVATDRRRLSGLTATPLKQIEQAAERCCAAAS